MSLLTRVTSMFRAGAAAESQRDTKPSVAETAALARGLRGASAIAIAHARARGHRAVAEGFKAGQHGRLTADLPTTPLPIDELIRRQLRTVRARSRRAYETTGFLRGFLLAAQDGVLGPTGPQLQMKLVDADGKLEAFVNTAVEAAWRRFCENPELCDQTGQWTFYDLSQTAFGSAIVDGEILLRKVRGRQAGSHGFRLQLLDAELLPVDYEKELGDERLIRFGIEYDGWDRPIAWHLIKPGTQRRSWMGGYWAREYQSFGPDDILHRFIPRATGQRRGFPWSASTLFRYHMLNEGEDASLIAFRAGASKTGFITTQPGEAYQGQGAENTEDPDSPRTFEVEPMVIEELSPGQQFQEYSPDFPNDALQPFLQQMLHGCARGDGVSYMTLTGDLKGTSFSSGRMGLDLERGTWKRLQMWHLMHFQRPVFREWLAYALLAGAIQVNGRVLSFARYEDLVASATWQYRGFPYVNPKDEADANLREVGGRMRSRASVIRARGDDPESVWEEIAYEERRLKSLGIPPVEAAPAPAAVEPRPGKDEEVDS